MLQIITIILVILLPFTASAQGGNGVVTGTVISNGKKVESVSVGLIGTNIGTYTKADGSFVLENITAGVYKIRISGVSYVPLIQTVKVEAGKVTTFTGYLQENESKLNEVVVTGTLKETFKSESPVPVEVISSKFFLKNPSPSIFESMAMVNGVQPQLNCNVCNTGDIHINGMEGPYTMITIDGMPIVSSLSSVYGLSGIPNSIVQRVEVVKGPASTLYGSEAVGGLINIITKHPQSSPLLNVDVFATSNFEINTDVALKSKLRKANSLLGINYFSFKNKMDKNGDNFTDVALQDRVSIFNKWSMNRLEGREASIALRFVYEDRWGGEMQWTPEFRGGDSIYGESIYTTRYEAIGKYDLPVAEDISLNFSYTNHHQNSAYGATSFIGQQNIAFLQLLWHKDVIEKHKILLGVPFRYTFYDDNTIGTQTEDLGDPKTLPQNTFLPGIFIQDEIQSNKNLTTLLGIRYDYNTDHGNIFSPRVSIKYSLNKDHVFRLGAGNGYRVVNLFTEEHAALTGSRKVIVEENLKPEQSYNINLNYSGFLNHPLGFVGLDASIFYTYFTNKIIGDFLSSEDSILYGNLAGHAVSKGISFNSEFQFMIPLKIVAGATLMDVYSKEKVERISKRVTQINAPAFSGTFSATYTFQSIGLSIDYTGRVMGPMKLSTLPNDFRPNFSPWFTLQNIQVTKKISNFEIYSGVKNIFNFIPKNPIMRAYDPFDRDVNSEQNPNKYTFDTTYNYAPLLGIRAFLGIRYNLQ